MLEAGIEQSEAGWLHARVAAPQGRTFAVAEHALQPRKRRRTSSGRRSTRRAGKRRCPGSCAPRRASPACCAIKAAIADAIACLQPVYDRFTEGFGTADLIAAKQLLDDDLGTPES